MQSLSASSAQKAMEKRACGCAMKSAFCRKGISGQRTRCRSRSSIASIDGAGEIGPLRLEMIQLPIAIPSDVGAGVMLVPEAVVPPPAAVLVELAAPLTAALECEEDAGEVEVGAGGCGVDAVVVEAPWVEADGVDEDDVDDVLVLAGACGACETGSSSGALVSPGVRR